MIGRVLLCVGLLACGDRLIDLASDPHDGATPSLDAGVPAQCGDAVCACDNGLDDDADGLADGFDPECTGAFDHDELSFATGVISHDASSCRDCYFDDNTSGDDDGCQVHVACISSGAPPMPMMNADTCPSCDVSKKCEDACRPRTPNGCDCFGCCTIDIKGTPKVNISLQDTCSLALLADQVACPRCVPNDQCRNPCGRCELCAGRTEADLPKDCKDDKPMAPGHQCDDQEAVCGPMLPCVAGFYCQQGCCLPMLL